MACTRKPSSTRCCGRKSGHRAIGNPSRGLYETWQRCATCNPYCLLSPWTLKRRKWRARLRTRYARRDSAAWLPCRSLSIYICICLHCIVLLGLEQAPVADKIYDHALESVQALLKDRVREQQQDNTNQGSRPNLLAGSKSLECRIIGACVDGSGSGSVTQCVNIRVHLWLCQSVEQASVLIDILFPPPPPPPPPSFCCYCRYEFDTRCRDASVPSQRSISRAGTLLARKNAPWLGVCD